MHNLYTGKIPVSVSSDAAVLTTRLIIYGGRKVFEYLMSVNLIENSSKSESSDRDQASNYAAEPSHQSSSRRREL